MRSVEAGEPTEEGIKDYIYRNPSVQIFNNKKM